VPDWPRLAASRHSNSLFHLARARPIVETKRKRLMKYYATRQCMPAHAALPLIRTRENRSLERVLSIPYLVPLPPQRSGHTLCMARRFIERDGRTSFGIRR